MTNLIKETLQAEVASLQAQLDLIEKQAERLKETLATYQSLLAEEDEVEIELVYEENEEEVVEETPAVEEEPIPEEEKEEEVEIELIYDETEEEESEATAEEFAEEEDELEEPIEEPIEESVEEPVVTTTTTTLLPPISDIRKAISLGDRFLFQRELFAGNGELMTKTIEKLNGLSSLEEAMGYIAKHFNWDSESQAYELFINILKRRW